MDPDAPIVRRDRLDQGRLVCRKVPFREVTAGLLHGACDAPRYRARVESVGPAFGDLRDRCRKVCLEKDLARGGGPTVQQEAPGGGLVRSENVFVLSPVAGDDLGYGVAVLRELPGGLKQARQRQVAKTVRGVLPETDRARDGNGKATGLRHLGEAPIPVLLDVDGLRGPARTVGPGYPGCLGLVVSRKASPPMPVCIGARTAIAAAIATHASAAVPPLSRTRSPIVAALGCSQATAPFVPKTVERPPRSGLLLAVSSFGARPADLLLGSLIALQFIESTGGIFAQVDLQEVTRDGGKGIYVGGT